MKYSIVIPTYNHLEDCLRPCVDSIIKTTKLEEVELIIVANGCSDGTRDYILQLYLTPNINLVYVEYKEAIGYTKATNAGLKLARGEYIVLLNNDTVVLDWGSNSDWLTILEEPFKKIPDCGLSGTSKQYNAYSNTDFLIFYCVMIARKTFDKIGLLDEIFSPGSGEDIDYCVRALKQGFSIHEVPLNEGGFHDLESNLYINSYPLYHRAEATVHGLANWDEIFSRNMNIIRDRYNKK